MGQSTGGVYQGQCGVPEREPGPRADASEPVGNQLLARTAPRCAWEADPAAQAVEQVA